MSTQQEAELVQPSIEQVVQPEMPLTEQKEVAAHLQDSIISTAQNTVCHQTSSIEKGPCDFAKDKPTEYSSSNVWRQADLPKVSMNTKTDRFYRAPAGGFFSETSYYGTSFNVPNPNHVPRDNSNLQDYGSGRPLWLSEINKNVPAAATYDLEGGIGAKSALNRTRATAFKAHNTEMNKTMRE